MIEHPIAYPCGCVFAFRVDSFGWEIQAGNIPKGWGKSKICEDHRYELEALGLWGGKR